MIFPPRLTKSTTDFSHTLNQLLVKQIFLQVQVIFTIAWKKQISGEPNLTGVYQLTAYHRFVPDTPPSLVPTASLIRVRPLVAVSQG